jgi:TldD protein
MSASPIPDKTVLHRLIGILLDAGADFCDVFCEDSSYNAVTSDDRKINTSYSTQLGAGLRAVKDHCTFYTDCTEMTPDKLEAAARRLAAGLPTHSTLSPCTVVLADRAVIDMYSRIKIDPAEARIELKHDLVRQAQEAAWGYSGKIRQVTARYSDIKRDVLVASSHANEVVRQRLGLTEFVITVFAGSDSERQMGWSGKSFFEGMEALTGENSPTRFAEAACKQAITMLKADDCPRGEVPVVFAPGENGILFHESCGHGMEADLIEKGSSFAGLLGQRVASEKVTIHDNGTLAGYPGSYAFDDEGTPSQDTLLIENGRLCGYLHTILTASRFNVNPTGSGRRQSYAFPPIPRMRNTYISAGPDDPEEIIRSTKKGIYAADVGFGGQVDVVTGRFITSILLGFLIEDGKLTRPVKGATITGNGIQALKDIDMVGNDLVINHSPGRCGKGQEVPVGVGMPTVRVRKLTVGGTGSTF